MPLGSHGFELGALRLEPSSGRTTTGHIVVKGETEDDQMMAWVVSPDGYRAAGLNPQHSMQGVRIRPYRTATGETQLRLEGVPLMPSPYDLLVIAGDPGAARVGKYRIDASALAREIPVVSVSKQLLGSLQARRAQAPPQGTPSGAAVAAAKTSPALSDDAGLQRLAQARAAIEAWRQAWSAKDIDAYIAAYAPDYAGREAERSREAWIAERRQRIVSRRNISVGIADLELSERDGDVVATFDQTYRADELVLRSRKQLRLAPTGAGRWLIIGETELR
jgi:ketosteroid isomerase-like protein